MSQSFDAVRAVEGSGVCFQIFAWKMYAITELWSHIQPSASLQPATSIQGKWIITAAPPRWAALPVPWPGSAASYSTANATWSPLLQLMEEFHLSLNMLYGMLAFILLFCTEYIPSPFWNNWNVHVRHHANVFLLFSVIKYTLEDIHQIFEPLLECQ